MKLFESAEYNYMTGQDALVLSQEVVDALVDHVTAGHDGTDPELMARRHFTAVGATVEALAQMILSRGDRRIGDDLNAVIKLLQARVSGEMTSAR